MKDKLFCARKLLSSRSFVLVTDTEAFLYTDLTGITPKIQIYTLRHLQDNLNKSIKSFETMLRGSYDRKTPKKKRS